MNSPDWDALAPYWEHFQDGGLNRATLAGLGPLPRPLLLVGSGLGNLSVGASLSIDRSLAMCVRAQQMHGVDCVAADAMRLPLRNASFATVLCSTGVLEYLSHSGRARVLGELGRACRPHGQVLAFAACGDNGVHWGIDQHSLVRAWFADRLAMPAFDSVATAMGDRAAAYSLLLSCLPERGQAVSGDDLAAASADAGMTVLDSHVDNNGIGRWRLALR